MLVGAVHLLLYTNVDYDVWRINPMRISILQDSFFEPHGDTTRYPLSNTSSVRIHVRFWNSVRQQYAKPLSYGVESVLTDDDTAVHLECDDTYKLPSK